MAAIPVDPREELERLERKHAENPEGRYFVPLADAYRRSGDLSGAIDLLRAGLARHPDYLSAHVVLGRCYADSGDPDAAETEFRYVLSLDPQNLIALRTLGDIAHVQGRLREAERWYRDLLAVDPMNDDARSALGQLQAEEPESTAEEPGAGMVPAGSEPSPGRGSGFDSPDTGTYGLDAAPGDMVDLRAEDDRDAGFDDSDAVVTETIAELYTRQGFYDRAADVYRELIRRRGGDDALEAKLRRVESIASGAATGDHEPIPPAGSHRDEDDAGRGTPSTADEAPNGLEWDDRSTPEEGLAPTYPDDSLYPLIGPPADFAGGGLDHPTQDREFEAIPPAYDFALPGDRDDSDSAADDPDDLLIDSYADPFSPETSTPSMDLSARSFGSGSDRPAGSEEVPDSGLIRPDPFADSFAEGFPALEDEAPLVGGAPFAATSPHEAHPPAAAPAPGDMPIGAFLRSVATWSRTGQERETAAAAGLSVTGPSAGDRSEESDTVDLEPLSSSSLSGLEAVGSEESSPQPAHLMADLQHDIEPGLYPSDAEPTSDTADAGLTAAEPSGADDLQLVTGTDDLFPWEIPVPDQGSQRVPPVQPLDLDPGYPFDETPQAEAPFVDEAVHSERSPSEAVEPSRSDALDEAPVPTPPADETGSMDSPTIPPAEDEAGGQPSSSPADAGDDDDLESFQAWLRSLKR
jgi:tetratricopeptide (TPR) repeat protein